MNLIIIIVSIMVPVTFGFRNTLIAELGLFCKTQHYKYVSILESPLNNLYSQVKLQKELMNFNLRVKIISNLDNLLLQDFIIFFYIHHDEFNDWNILSNRFVKTSLVIIDNRYLNTMIDSILYENINLNIYCMIIHNDNVVSEFKEIMALKNQTKVLINDINLNINFYGMTFTTITGDWWPYFNVRDIVGTNCVYDGFLVDFMDEAGIVTRLDNEMGSQVSTTKNYYNNFLCSYVKHS